MGGSKKTQKNPKSRALILETVPKNKNNPKKDINGNYGKNDDHLAQIMELMGRFPKKMSSRGVKGKKYISKEGALNRIPKLQNW